MNIWTKKSVVIANSPGYLDKLGKIYIMQVNPERPLNPKHEAAVIKAFNNGDTKTLIRLLIKSEVFPIKDSFIGFLRAKEDAIDQNPETTKRIGDRLYSLGLKSLVRETTRPKETNRQLGSAFRLWLPTLGFPILDAEDFERYKGVAILRGADKFLKKYAEGKLGCKLKKGIDILFKKGEVYVIGEAKFLTTPGGEQDRGFDDAASFIKNRTGVAKRIALIDGYIWLKSKRGLYNKILKSNLDIFSALLLKDYIAGL